MIDGAILAVELGLFLILLLKVWRVQSRKENENTGFFAYLAKKPVNQVKDKSTETFKKPPHA